MRGGDWFALPSLEPIGNITAGFSFFVCIAERSRSEALYGYVICDVGAVQQSANEIAGSDPDTVSGAFWHMGNKPLSTVEGQLGSSLQPGT